MADEKKPWPAIGGPSSIIAVISTLIAFFSQFTDYFRKLTDVLESLHVPKTLAHFLLTLPFVCALIFYLREKSKRKSRVRTTEILDRAIKDPSQLYGRTKGPLKNNSASF
jgi:hypothetical protein